MIERTCQYCDKHFFIYPSEARRGRGKYCSCACSGKARIGTHLSMEAKSKVSIANSGKPRLQELRERVSATLKMKYANGYIHPMLGKRHSRESRAKMSLAQKGKYRRSEAFKAFISDFMKKKWQDDSAFRREVLKVLVENHKLVSQRMKRLWQNPQYRQHQIEKHNEYYNDIEVRKQVSERSRRKWQDPDYVSIVMKARGIKPSKPERQLINILSRYFPKFEYNGDGRLGVTLGGLTPDFVNINGKKDLIEVFGDYYHSPEVTRGDWRRSELGKVMIYNSLGWKCLVIWEHELKELTEQELVNKITTFFRRKAKSRA